jgi:hypothetical protein
MADTRNQTSDGTGTLAAVSNTVFEIFDLEPVQPPT